MQYNNVTEKNGIIQRVEMLTGMGDGAISGDAVLLKQVTGLVNESYFEVFPGVWRHGDFIKINHRGGCYIKGEQLTFYRDVFAPQELIDHITTKGS